MTDTTRGPTRVPALAANLATLLVILAAGELLRVREAMRLAPMAMVAAIAAAAILAVVATRSLRTGGDRARRRAGAMLQAAGSTLVATPVWLAFAYGLGRLA